MATIIIRYEDNDSMRYDGKEYSLSKVCREKRATGALQIGESVMMKMKLRIWKGG